ncbi:MAG: phosphatase PAP2 family protein [Mollicutes bacterium]|nr:phosphatase PAP2 family protein [Mollicutes bacterium]
MELTAVAEWLNTSFSGFDHAILSVLHELALLTNGNLNWLFKFISLFAEKGLFLILLSIFLMLFKKTRKFGICMFGAIGAGAILTNFILKDMVARPRPYMSGILEYKDWWQYAGMVTESDFSFPSGHTTAMTAAMMSLVFMAKTKKKYWCIVFIFLMGVSRNYLMVHYPTDVIGGMISGLVGATVAYFITLLIYKIIEKYKDVKLFNFIKNFDIINAMKK